VITGVHALVFSREAEAVRGFFRGVLGRGEVEASDGWPIFALPPAELAVHPADGAGFHELYLMCDDVEATIGELEAKGVRCSAVEDQGWGLVTTVLLPGGDEIQVYQPRHPTAISSG
jgi:catechol 2,3-dioxygenase-like lactoylglutathione lyase family enzyme